MWQVLFADTNTDRIITWLHNPIALFWFYIPKKYSFGSVSLFSVKKLKTDEHKSWWTFTTAAKEPDIFLGVVWKKKQS